MTEPTDTAVEKAKRRKDKSDRTLWREQGPLGAIKTLLTGWAAPAESEECERCLAQRTAA